MSTPGTQRRKDRLAQIEKCVCNDRQNTYGDAEDNFANIAEYWTLWLRSRKLLQAHARVEAHDVAVMSGLIKVARLSTSPDHIDNWDDLAGYAVCGGGIRMPKTTFKSGEIITNKPDIKIETGSEWKHIQKDYRVIVLGDVSGWVRYQTDRNGILQAEREVFLRDYQPTKITVGSVWRHKLFSNYKPAVVVDATELAVAFIADNKGYDFPIEEFLNQYEPSPTPTT